jgi:hypothetical protein
MLVCPSSAETLSQQRDATKRAKIDANTAACRSQRDLAESAEQGGAGARPVGGDDDDATGIAHTAARRS